MSHRVLLDYEEEDYDGMWQPWWENYISYLCDTIYQYAPDKAREALYADYRATIVPRENPQNKSSWYIDFEDERDYIAMVLKWT